MSLELLVVLLLILAAEFVNGWTDAPNAIATVVGTRALSPRSALAMASVFNLLGVLSGTAVAATIGKDIIDPSAVTLTTVGGAMVGIVVWSTIAARGASRPARAMPWWPAWRAPAWPRRVPPPWSGRGGWSGGSWRW